MFSSIENTSICTNIGDRPSSPERSNKSTRTTSTVNKQTNEPGSRTRWSSSLRRRWGETVRCVGTSSCPCESGGRRGSQSPPSSCRGTSPHCSRSCGNDQGKLEVGTTLHGYRSVCHILRCNFLTWSLKSVNCCYFISKIGYTLSVILLYSVAYSEWVVIDVLVKVKKMPVIKSEHPKKKSS